MSEIGIRTIDLTATFKNGKVHTYRFEMVRNVLTWAQPELIMDEVANVSIDLKHPDIIFLSEN